MSELQERIAAFDAAVECTLNALRHPDVVSGLGSMATRLVNVTEELFLPTISHRVASVPLSCKDSDRFAFIPHTASDAEYGLRLDETFLEPTAGRYQQAIKLFAQRWNIGLDDAQAEMDDLIASLYEDGHKIKAPKMADRKGTNGSLVINGPFGDLSYRTRPTIHMPIIRILGEHRYRVAGTLAHEEVHAIDAEARHEPGLDKPYRAYTELRGYHVGAVIRQAGAVLAGDGKTEIVEGLRTQYNNDSDPYAISDELIQKLDKLGVLS